MTTPEYHECADCGIADAEVQGIGFHDTDSDCMVALKRENAELKAQLGKGDGR